MLPCICLLMARSGVSLRCPAIGGEADIHGRRGSTASAADDPGCVKTHTVAKCRKNNSPGRHHASRVQYDLTLRYAISSRSFYARSEGWSFYAAKTHSGHRAD